MLFLALVGLRVTPAAFLAALNDALIARGAAELRADFAYPDVDSPYLFQMAKDRHGLNHLTAAMIPAPPGWTNHAQYWAIFHTFQDIEEDHDAVYEVLPAVDGFRLGHEVREDDLNGLHVLSEAYRAKLTPESNRVDVDVTVNIGKGTLNRAPVFRVNDVYVFGKQPTPVKVIVADQTSIPKPTPGSLVRAGSLLIPWTTQPQSTYQFAYSGILKTLEEDKIGPTAAYVTAWWLPSLGRLPYTVNGEIDAPKAWTVRGEGIQTGVVEDGDRRVTSFNCDLPISYPKVIGGKYTLAAKKEVAGQTFKVFQLDPVEPERANRDLDNMVAAAAFFQSKFGPLPFPGYECYDADSYYGIESYSHTLLQRNITHFISHEMGHSYFGGIVPCTYVHDSWNEGVTEYVDSVLLLGDRDRSLESALSTIDIATPLSAMPVPHDLSGASYWRGCYVMKMLEAEIGQDKVIQALATMVHDRRGLDTRWRDLRPYFEEVSHTSLGWFWDQWIDNAQFPTLSVTEVTPVKTENHWHTLVTVLQLGTPHPFRLRFSLTFNVRGTKQTKQVQLDRDFDDFTFDSDAQPTDVRIEAFPLTLAHLKQYPG
jgi:hypothetical protein